MLLENLTPDETEIAIAISAIKQKYQYKRNQLIQALGRNPTSEEMFMVAKNEIVVLSDLHRIIERMEHNPRFVIPASLLGQIFLTKILRNAKMYLPNEEIAHDQPE